MICDKDLCLPRKETESGKGPFVVQYVHFYFRSDSLEGTAFPSWNGNSVLTSHVYLANGLPGPFVNLSRLRWGDQIIVHAYGSQYIYEVRSSRIVGPDDLSVLRHEELPWLTLVTCRQYDEASGAYRYRVVVRAVLLRVTPEP